jgi:glycogen debranching enzyme
MLRSSLARFGYAILCFTFSWGLAVTVQASPKPSVPVLVFEDSRLDATLGNTYRAALDNLLVTNILPADLKKYNRTGLLTGELPQLIRAGGNYHDPWTRDASVNSWNAASLLCPEVARNTLWAVCERQPNGRLIIQRDNQWWDKLIWVTAAWNHYAITGDRAFLSAAFEATEASLEELLQTRFDAEHGLFQGPSHLADGIAGYPAPFDDPKGSSSFILDHPGADKMMTLSANAIAYHALRCAAKMADALARDAAVSARWNKKADAVRAAINRHFWMAGKQTYAYLLHGDGPWRGKPAEFQEATGISLVILFGIADAKRAAQVVANTKTTEFGIALLEPEIPRYSANRPSRHGRVIWPMAQGYWATAAARTGSVSIFQRETEALAGLVKGSGWNFWEIYSPATGKPDGGWQCGRHWGSCQHQTWSATAYLRMIHYGLFGMTFEPDGIRFSPVLPTAWGKVTLQDLNYREQQLEIRLTGRGMRIKQFRLDGKRMRNAFLPATLTGKHQVAITLAE